MAQRTTWHVGPTLGLHIGPTLGQPIGTNMLAHLRWPYVEPTCWPYVGPMSKITLCQRLFFMADKSHGEQHVNQLRK